MTDLAQLEDRINKDPRLRQEFFDNPVSVLSREGLTLSTDQERMLRESVAKLLASRPPVGGASVREKIGIIMIGG